jgi:tetratricopeptide (TPR) repeat protein
LDPGFALAIAGLALTHTSAAFFGWTDSREQSVDEAKRLARKSLELDEREHVAQAALAFALGLAGQQQQMIAALERVIELSPSNAFSYGNLGLVLATERPDDAITYLKRAMLLSPKDPGMFLFLTGMGWAHFSSKRYEEAASLLEQSRQRRPDFQSTHLSLAATYAQLGRLEEARMALQEVLQLQPGERMSLAKERERLRWLNPDYLERHIDGLRKAGLPEGTEA